MIKTWKEIRNLKNLAIELQKIMKKIKCMKKKLGGAAALMYEPPLITMYQLLRFPLTLTSHCVLLQATVPIDFILQLGNVFALLSRVKR